MRIQTIASGLLLCWMPMCFAEAEKQTLKTLSYGSMLNWLVGLILVLGIFFLCVWSMRKLNGLVVNNADKMRVVGGLSLGMREKVVLLQVGKKQLLLGVTPGRIDTLHVLEGEDCLNIETSQLNSAESGFAKHLLQAIQAGKGRTDA
jgi:flagellar protein FliO/FliZ